MRGVSPHKQLEITMTSYLLAGPASEPVTLAEAKAFLRIGDDAEDGFIATLITAARLHIEGVTGRALIEQSWRVVLDVWPANRRVTLPVGPLSSLTAIRAYDEAGTPATIALAQFQPETAANPARVFLPSFIAGMPLLRERAGIEIDYVAGYGTAAADVPADLKHALLTLIGYWFEHRDAVVIAGSGAVVPTGFDRLVATYRRVSL
jgi:uncharacterized phiE125 gp8 family phage protein